VYGYRATLSLGAQDSPSLPLSTGEGVGCGVKLLVTSLENDVTGYHHPGDFEDFVRIALPLLTKSLRCL
jgi:hypothetical protein